MLTATKSQVLQALERGARDYWAIAAGLDIAPFTVRAELRGLERDGLVRYAGDRWELTNSGYRAIWDERQLTIG
jgi:predicted transcriptional regulator